jgi:hypothetical protein
MQYKRYDGDTLREREGTYQPAFLSAQKACFLGPAAAPMIPSGNKETLTNSACFCFLWWTVDTLRMYSAGENAVSLRKQCRWMISCVRWRLDDTGFMLLRLLVSSSAWQPLPVAVSSPIEPPDFAQCSTRFVPNYN